MTDSPARTTALGDLDAARSDIAATLSGDPAAAQVDALLQAARNTIVAAFAASPLADPAPPPLAVLMTASGTTAEVGAALVFSATPSGGTPPMSITWDFGDGITASGGSTSHAYATAGPFRVRATATDAGGQTASAEFDVSIRAVIQPPPPPPPMDGPSSPLHVVPIDKANVTVSGTLRTSAGTLKTGDKVYIPVGATLLVDDASHGDANPLTWIRIGNGGALRFDTEAPDVAFCAEHVIGEEGSWYECGTAEKPFLGRLADICVTDPGPMDRVADPLALGRGIVLMGGVSIHGRDTTDWVTAAPPAKGDASLTLDADVDWTPGATLVIPGTLCPEPAAFKVAVDRKRIQDEVRAVVDVDGRFVTLDRPLEFDHKLPGGVRLPVGRLDRNIVIRSDNATDPTRRGHVMIMGPSDLPRSLSHARFSGLGRTRADRLVTDPQLDADGKLLPPLDSKGVPLPTSVVPDGIPNDRARYSFHFHRCGVSVNSPAATVTGCVVDDGLKWGFVNHLSRVHFADCVSYDVDGSGFSTEAGPETGTFTNCLAIRSIGPDGARRQTEGTDIDFNALKTDLPGGLDVGWAGYGFWIQSPLVRLKDCAAVGHAREAFATYGTPVLPEYTLAVSDLPPEWASLERDPASAGDDPTKWRIRTTVPTRDAPAVLTDCVAIASRTGFAPYYSLGSATARKSGIRGEFARLVSVNCRTHHFSYYTSMVDWVDFTEINAPDFYGATGGFGIPQDAGWDWYGDSGDHTWTRGRCVGLRIAMRNPTRGDLKIKDCTFEDCYLGVLAPGSGAYDLTLDNPTFNPPTDSARLKQLATLGLNPANITLLYEPGEFGDAGKNWAALVTPKLPFVNTVKLIKDGVSRPLYWRETGRSYPLSTSDDNQSRRLAAMVPASWQGKTNGDLADGAIGGLGLLGVAPVDATPMSGLRGLAGPPTTP